MLRNHATGCPFQSRSPGNANRPMKRPLNGLQIGFDIPGSLSEGSDHLTGAYDPGSWAYYPRQWPKRTQLRRDDGYGSVVVAEG